MDLFGASNTAQKMEFDIKDFFSKCETADLVTFIEKNPWNLIFCAIDCRRRHGCVKQKNSFHSNFSDSMHDTNVILQELLQEWTWQNLA